MDNIQYVDGVKDKTGRKVMRDLTEEERDWLNQFNKEYYNATRKDAVFHTEDEDWRGEGGLWEANNARNRCLLNIGKATNTVDFITMGSYDQNTIKALEGHDLELLLAYNAGLIKDLNEDDDEDKED